MLVEKIIFHISVPPFSNSLVVNLLELHKDRDQSFKKFLSSLLLIGKKDFNCLYIITGYFKGQIISSIFLYIPDQNLPQEMRCAFIANVIVLSDFQHRGIATRGMKISERICEKHNCSGILLATSNENLKEKFYYKLNFNRYRNDDWLLKKDLNTKPYTEAHCQKIYKVTSVDLATIQSICAFPHYRIQKKIIKVIECCEIEEDFLKLLENFPNQFLYMENISSNNNSIIAWVVFDKNTCNDIILNFRNNDIDNKYLKYITLRIEQQIGLLQ